MGGIRLILPPLHITRNRIIELTLTCTLLSLYLARHWFGVGGWRPFVLILIFSVPIVYIKSSKRSLKEIYLAKNNLKESLFHGLIGSILLISINVVILYHVLGGFYLAPELKEFIWWFPLASFLGNLLGTGLLKKSFLEASYKCTLEIISPAFGLFWCRQSYLRCCIQDTTLKVCTTSHFWYLCLGSLRDLLH